MKNICGIMSILLFVGMLQVGCDDLITLDEKPFNFLSEEQFFQNEADAEAAVGAALAVFQSLGMYQQQFPLGQFLLSDIGEGRGHYEPLGRMDFSLDPVQRYVWAPWTAMYLGINRTNLALEKIPAIEMSESRKNVLLGQLYFVRAFNYVQLVRNWGGVPLRLTSSKGYDQLAEPRSTAEKVYEQIISDLELAESLLPDTDVNGRPTKWAAKTLLADVYLGTDKWSLASAKAKEVIDSKRYSLVIVEVSEDFEQIFGPELAPTSEEIFNIPFRRQAGYGMHHPAVFHHSSTSYAGSPFRGVWLNMKAPFLINWDENDLRHDFNLYVGDDTQYLTPAEPQRPKKFKDPLALDRLGHGNDQPIFRYPEVLLIFAEAESQAQGGPTAEAYDAVNQVRRRAYGLPLDTSAPGVDLPAGLSAEQFREKIIDERGWEFLVEAKRLWDLKRTGTYQAALTVAGKQYDFKWLLWPLPPEELDANDALTLEDQNPGW